jgi:hypothetical protein
MISPKFYLVYFHFFRIEKKIGEILSSFHKKRPTKRAADGWESARFTSIFLALGFFYISS